LRGPEGLESAYDRTKKTTTRIPRGELPWTTVSHVGWGEDRGVGENVLTSDPHWEHTPETGTGKANRGGGVLETLYRVSCRWTSNPTGVDCHPLQKS